MGKGETHMLVLNLLEILLSWCYWGGRCQALLALGLGPSPEDGPGGGACVVQGCMPLPRACLSSRQPSSTRTLSLKSTCAHEPRGWWSPVLGWSTQCAPRAGPELLGPHASPAATIPSAGGSLGTPFSDRKMERQTQRTGKPQLRLLRYQQHSRNFP